VASIGESRWLVMVSRLWSKKDLTRSPKAVRHVVGNIGYERGLIRTPKSEFGSGNRGAEGDPRVEGFFPVLVVAPMERTSVT